MKQTMKMSMKKSLGTTLAAIALFGVQPIVASAQEFPTRQPITPVTTAAVPQAGTIIAQEDIGQVISVPLNGAVTLSLKAPVSNIVLAQPNIADIHIPGETKGKAQARKYVYLLGKTIGSTSVIMEDKNGDIVFSGAIEVDVDVSGLRDALKTLLPKENIRVAAHRNGIFLSGAVRSPQASASAITIAKKFAATDLDVTNMMSLKGSQQVVLQVRIAEIKRTAYKNLDISQPFGIDGARGMALSGAIHNLSDFTDVGGFFATGGLNLGIPFLGAATFNILEEEGLANTLAEPTLTALSGETAAFLAGGEFPLITGLDQNGLPTYEMQPFGVSLNFTPTVTDKGAINLRLNTEVSARDSTVGSTYNNTTFPGLSKKSTETTVVLPSGGSMMIGGLIQEDFANQISGFPFLKDLPILGALFRSTNFQDSKSELVVMVTAYLAKPTDATNPLSAPTDGFALSSDIDIYLLGRLHREYMRQELPPHASTLKGPYGYIME